MVYQVGDSNRPFQRDVPDSLGVEVKLGLHGFHKGEAGEVLEVNFAVVLTGAAPLLLHPGMLNIAPLRGVEGVSG